MKIKLILIETDKSNLILNTINNRLIIGVGNILPIAGKSYDIILIDPEADIVKGDLYIMEGEIMNPVSDAKEADRCNNHYSISRVCSKIISSTNKSHNLDNVDRLEDIETGIYQLSHKAIKFLISYYNDYKYMLDWVGVETEKLAKYEKVLLPCSPHNNESNSDMSIYKEYIKLNQQGEVDLTIPKVEEKLYTEKDMNNFAAWYIKNTGQFSDDSIALKQGKYLKMWLTSKKK